MLNPPLKMEPFIKNVQERRKHKRFKSKGEVYAVSRAARPILGRIIDISEGGLSILYIEGEEEPSTVLEFDLFTLDDDVNVRAVAAIARSDQELSHKNGGESETTRRRGIEFLDLAQGQRDAVRGLIRKQTSGNGDSRGD